MARNVFISFRYSDGHWYKEDLAKRFDRNVDTVDYSEDQNRSGMSDYTIQAYLYSKLRRSSVTIVLITPEAVNHKRDWYGRYSDWMYDEIRFSLENREGNRTNGIVAVYTKEAEPFIVERTSDGTIIKDFDNLCRANMMNVKASYKKNPQADWYDKFWDSYCTLVSYEDFKNNISGYIDNAIKKRDEKYKYDITCRL